MQRLSHLTRRQFLGTAAGAALLTACGRTAQPPQATPVIPTSVPATVVAQLDVPTVTADATRAALEPTAPPTAAPPPTAVPEPTSPPPTAVPTPARPAGPPAPEIQAETWINSPPLRWNDLRGRVVMVEFWTYG